MDITPFTLYIITVLDGLNKGLLSFSVVFGVASLLSLAFFVATRIDNYTKYIDESTKYLKITFFTFVFTVLAGILIPSTKEAIFIFGVPYILESVKGSELSKVPPKFVEYLNLYIDKEVTDMKSIVEQKRQK